MEYPKPITSIDDLPKRYGGLERERYWQQYWMDSGIYNYDPSRPREEVYSVDTPPPTVSGALHIGHVYSYTHTDFSLRYQRMAGKHVFYPFGFDDNGLPSERLVERVTGKRAHEVGREEFIKLCTPILRQAEQEFKDLWQSLALSCDWSQFYTTIDARSRAISQASFIDLYNKGYVYRKEAPTMWCWVDQTAIAQAEIEDKEVPGKFHDITFHFDDGSGKLMPVTIATTRPELVPACVAVFAHPDDERYKHLFGKKAITPLFEVEVPILPSVKADPAKGTGILMCCTFGDTDDVEHWEMEWPKSQVVGGKLPTRVIIGRNGRILKLDEPMITSQHEVKLGKTLGALTEHSITNWLPHTQSSDVAKRTASRMGEKSIEEAREIIVEELSAAGLLGKVEDIEHIVRHSERGKVPIEIIVTPQWYVKLLEYKDQLIEQGRKVNWYPQHMLKRFEHWVEGLNQDWCISRQRYNGVPFPVWFASARVPICAQPTDTLPANPLVSNPSKEALACALQRCQERKSEICDDNSTRAALEKHELDEAILKFGRALNDEIPVIHWRDVHSHYDKEEDWQEFLSGNLIISPDFDVMDTWATSSLTPLLCTHLRIGVDDPATRERHDKLYPMDLRPQAHDIIRTWAFYTITKAYYHFGVIPWRDIVISGHAQDVGRRKITKSDGHTVTPADMVEKYTADGLRYWASGCKLGTDTLYDEHQLGDGKRLITKLFNATKFALRHLLDFDPTGGAGGSAGGAGGSARDSNGVQRRPPHQTYDIDALLKLVTYPTDKWMLERLRKTIERATKANLQYEFGDARQTAEDFFWADFCDNYLELSKGRLYLDNSAIAAHPKANPDQLRKSAQAALFLGLSAVLKLFAPVLPHVCEECWSWYHAQWTTGRSIHEEPWPPSDKHVASEDEMKAGQMLTDVVALVRKWKSEGNVSLKKPLERVYIHLDEDGQKRFSADGLQSIMGDLLSTCNARLVSVCALDESAELVRIDGNPYAASCELAEEA